MKKIVTMVLIMIPLLSIGQTVIHSNISYKYTPFIQSCCKKLNINPESIYILRTDKNVKAYVDKTFTYIIYININNIDHINDIYKILAHELIHIQQDFEGRWDIKNSTVKVHKEFNEYTSEQARNIEREANKISKVLYKDLRDDRFIHYNYKYCE